MAFTAATSAASRSIVQAGWMPLFEKHPALTRRETGLEAVAVGSGEAPHAPATKHLALRAVARSKRGQARL
jgi:hypothetical protein